ncbi:glycosyltransferase family 39 protein [Kitasatospora sp. NBC_00240]|uniref:glycosyltransferase family 39 protein n=1 Tax=Kitasatospora sp. NBC_00240 TaxID=2903567 RepID=UPI0022554409|nr:glycosyltransferase family 39 protein [Kitasatospora sp. NBC_00240]MCX5213668.1 glycosyltransferase family 39 protein [Kitasatospora sp. NBC_00240]
MTTTSSFPPTSDPWPEAANYPPPQAPARATVDPIFPPAALPPRGPKGPASWAGRLRTLPARTWRGREDDPRWARPALLGLLAATAVLYFWNLSASGWANSFYSAAVQAGSQSWKAFFYGSSDAANFITVDKPPMSLWPMALSVRIFGLSSWAILAPQVLMAVATVGTVYAAVRRRFSPLGGLVAGGALALTPVAALMFRFNNPDALLVLLLTLAAYGVLRATETAGTRWMVFTGVMFGFGFLTKTLQAFLVLPAFALIYLVVAPTGLGRRVRQLLLGALAMVVSAGWWVAVVQLVPAADRPYIGGSQDNSFLSVTFGYNGFGRITGNETGSVGGGGGGGGAGGGGGMWGSTGITRLFDGDIGGQIAWLMPAALILLVLGLWATRRTPRTDSARAAFLVWGGWLLCTALTFSFMSGIFHQYYTVALVPAVAALVGMGVDGLWRVRHRLPYAAVLGATLAVTAIWAYVLLGRSSDFLPWLRWAVLIGGLAAAAALLLAGRLSARLAAVTGLVGLAAALGGPAAYAVDTVSTGHSGSIVTAGPQVQGAGFGPGGGGRGGFGGRGGALELFGPGQQAPGQNGQGQIPGQGRNGQAQGQVPGQNAQGQGGQGRNGFPGMPQGGFGGRGGGTGGAGGGGGMGGLLNGARVDSELAALLKQGADRYTWVAAAVGSQNQASYQLASGEPVMALGGFNGTDPSLTLGAFQQYVTEGKIHYFIGGGMGGGMGGGTTTAAGTENGAGGTAGAAGAPGATGTAGATGGNMAGGGMGGSSESSEIATWVASHFTAKTVGSATIYDLTAPTG